MSGLISRPTLAYTLAILAIVVAALSGVLTVVFHFDDLARQHRQDQNELQLLQASLCDFFVPVGQAPTTPSTSTLGHTLIHAGQHGAQVISCPRKD